MHINMQILQAYRRLFCIYTERQIGHAPTAKIYIILDKTRPQMELSHLKKGIVLFMEFFYIHSISHASMPASKALFWSVDCQF